jgi:hypothetical protein
MDFDTIARATFPPRFSRRFLDMSEKRGRIKIAGWFLDGLTALPEIGAPGLTEPRHSRNNRGMPFGSAVLEGI